MEGKGGINVVFKAVSPKSEKRLYADRDTGGNRDYHHTGSGNVSCIFTGAREGEAEFMYVEYAPNWHGADYVPER